MATMMEWTYQLRFESAFGIFSGLSVAGLVDRMVVRDKSGLPIVPGSSVKGRWRYFAERILRAQKTGTNGNPFLHGAKQPACKLGGKETTCTICKWFGSPSITAALQVGSANLKTDGDLDWPALFEALHKAAPGAVIRPDTEVRPGVALSRKFRTAQPDHLFFDEAVPPVLFEGTIRLILEPSPNERKFLIGTAALVDALGARKAAGRGRLTGGIRINAGGGA
jgi:CRISPR/Cas system CSM-associated protein Csm3 (group 7 of RAMP superfamily)